MTCSKYPNCNKVCKEEDEKSPCEDCIWNARTWYKEGVNQTLAEVLNIVDKFENIDIQKLFKNELDEEEIVNYDIGKRAVLFELKEEIKNIQSPESTRVNKSRVEGASKDNNTQRSGCGEIVEGINDWKDFICGEVCKECNIKHYCEKCQGKVGE